MSENHQIELSARNLEEKLILEISKNSLHFLDKATKLLKALKEKNTEEQKPCQQ